jgi:hypothetical protein
VASGVECSRLVQVGASGRSDVARDTRAGLLFLGGLASGAFSVEPVAVTDWFRVIELVDTYRDFSERQALRVAAGLVA